jgi:hypothetical protein
MLETLTYAVTYGAYLHRAEATLASQGKERRTLHILHLSTLRRCAIAVHGVGYHTWQCGAWLNNISLLKTLWQLCTSLLDNLHNTRYGNILAICPCNTCEHDNLRRGDITTLHKMHYCGSGCYHTNTRHDYATIGRNLSEALRLEVCWEYVEHKQ